MKFKFNGIETDGKGSPVMGIPPIINDHIYLIAGDVLTMGPEFKLKSSFPVPNSFVAQKTGLYFMSKNKIAFRVPLRS